MSMIFQAGRNLKKAPGKGEIYGVTWDGTSSTALTRTDDAVGFVDPVPYMAGASSYSSPFDDIMPWKGMVKTEDSEAGSLVEIPKFWYKLTQSGAALSIQIANYAADGFSVSPAHMDRGDGAGERDVVYIGRYHTGTSGYKSTTGLSPRGSVTRANSRTSIHNLGTTIWQMDFAMRFTIWLLYIVEFADWDSQTKIGYGTGNNSAVQTMGYTDNMPYHTGTTQSSRITYGLGTQYRWIEGLWDNVYDWIDGCYYNNQGLNIILNPSSFNDSSNGTIIGTPSTGAPSTLGTNSTVFPMFYPTTSTGTTSTYIPDAWYFSSAYACLAGGGTYGRTLSAGLFCISYYGTTDKNGYTGSRLMKLP